MIALPELSAIEAAAALIYREFQATPQRVPPATLRPWLGCDAAGLEELS